MLFGDIKIGEKTYRMCSAASVNLTYFNIFHEDFMTLMNPEEPTKAIEPFIKMAFCMAMRGEKSKEEVRKLTVSDYEAWLDGFTMGDLINAMGDIQSLYLGSSVGTVKSKKNSGAQTES